MSTKRFLGYDKDENGKLVVNPQQAKIVIRLYEEFLSGKSPEALAQEKREAKRREDRAYYYRHRAEILAKRKIYREKKLGEQRQENHQPEEKEE